MAPSGAKRRLTTILAADVEGYSRLMRADEEATLATLKTYREIIDGLIARHDGRIFGTGGDSVLAEFGSAVEAVRAAISIQEELRVRNAELAETRRMHFRIGITVGDVMVEGDNLFGDGVNVAARLEGLAEAGGICISGSAFEQVKNKLTIGFEDIGPQEVKNIDEPVSAFRLVPGSEAAPAKTPTSARKWRPWALAAAAVAAIAVIGVAVWQYNREPEMQATAPEAATPKAAGQRAALPLPDRPSIAVLAFDNMSGDPEQEYFSDAISETIISNLAQLPGLFVIARNSSFSYKGKSATATHVAEELGVRYVLEGSVQRQGDRIRIIAQLIDARADEHVWTNTYDREVSDLFDLQDEISRSVVTNLQMKMKYAIHTTGTRNLEAYDLGIRAKMAYLRQTEEDNAQAIALASRAIELDPEYGRAYAYLAIARTGNWRSVWGDSPENTIERAIELAQKAVELDISDYYNHWILALSLRNSGQFDLAMAEYRRAIALGPNEPDVLNSMANLERLLGKHEDSFRTIKQAMRTNPFYPFWYPPNLGVTSYMRRDYEQAIASMNESLSLNPTSYRPDVWIAASYAQLGRQEEAETAAEIALKKNPKFTIAKFARSLPYADPADTDHMLEGFRKAGLPEGPPKTN